MIFKHLDSVKVQDRHSPVVRERIGLLAMGGRGWSNNIDLWDLGMGAGSDGHRSWMAVPGPSPAGNGIR